VLRFFRRRLSRNCGCCPNRLLPEPADGEFTQIKVTRQGQTPWFGPPGVGMKPWPGVFLLKSRGQDLLRGHVILLAPPADLLKYGPLRLSS